MVNNPWVLHQALLQKYFLVASRIPIDHPEHLIPQPLVEVGGLKTVGIEDGQVALLVSGFLFQGLEQSAAIAVTAEAGMDPEIRDLHTLSPERPHDPSHQLPLGVMDEHGHVPALIDCGCRDIVDAEFVAYGLDRAIAGVMVYRPME
jgi:hypothetical protein